MISYEPLWKTLFDRKMSKSELAKVTGLSRTTINKMVSGKSVTLDVVDRICEALHVPIYDVVESVSSTPASAGNGSEGEK